MAMLQKEPILSKEQLFNVLAKAIKKEVSMKQKVILRKAKPIDVLAIIDLCREHAIHEAVAYNSKNKATLLSKQLFQAKDFLQCIVLEYQENLVGYATFFKQFSTWQTAFYIYLDCLYLKKDFRGQGLGHQTMLHIKKYAIEQHCFHIQWQTPKANKNAIKFYHSLGAISKKKERFFWDLINK